MLVGAKIQYFHFLMPGFQKWVVMLPWDFLGNCGILHFLQCARSAPDGTPKKLNLKTFLETKFKFLKVWDYDRL